MASPSGRKSARVVSGRQSTSAPSNSKMKVAPASKSARVGGSGASGRGGDDNRRSKVSKPKGGIPKEFIIAVVVIAVLGVATISTYVMKSGKKKEIERTLENREATHNANVRLTYDTFMNAYNAGYKWVLGKDTTIKDDDLFGPLKTDKVYNVVYSRNFKDKKGKDQSEEKVMYPSRNRIAQKKGGDKKDNVEMTRGMTEEEKFDVYIAVRNIPAEPGDNVNLGGAIRVIVKVEKEE